MEQNILIKDLLTLVRDQEWLIGAVNYDGDLHFSSYYLRTSLNKETSQLYPGYTCFISIYKNFNEHYYLLKNECIHTSKKIIEKAENEPDWLNNILDKIRRGCKKLESIFDDSMDKNFFHSLSDDELLNIYRKHYKIHCDLYIYARLPEELDRGVCYFTNYLKQIIGKRIKSQEKCIEVFDKLTQPVSQSILSQAIDDYNNLLSFFIKNDQLRKTLLYSTGKARMLFPQSILHELQLYLRKWKFLNYHGYGKRELTSLSDLLVRLSNSLSGSNDREKIDFNSQLLRNRDARDKLLEELNFLPAQKQLFLIFPVIGEVKLLRRFTQLRNFYFLDLIISEFSQRLDCSEWTIRNMLPEEIFESFENPKIINKAGARQKGCIYVALDGKEYIFDSQYIQSVQEELEKSTSQQRDRKILKGVVACRGKVKGTCKIIIRSDSKYERSFPPGAILVSHSTDPDLLNILKISGAVLTEQGGVTSHAALICRELGIPTIIGINGLLDRISDGDTLEVDAENGTVKILQSASQTPYFIIDNITNSSESSIGGKAKRLVILSQMGYNVPPFILIDSNKIRSTFLNKYNSDISVLVEWIKKHLDVDNDSNLAIRSSSISEDTKDSSSAGKYESILNVKLASLESSIKRFLKLNDEKSEGKYQGTIIIQRMINPDFSGVCITNDKRITGTDSLVIELLCGNNDLLTSGCVIPDRYYIQRTSGDILKQEAESFQSHKKGVNIRKLAKQFLQLEEEFGCALDIEWAIIKDKLSILQVRPVV